ncbi:hypothetical protein F9B85_10845 [Heliorestis acidaminivorans]|uniref:Uncharacterized protein n=1 Tax=Heliorestis acidaminivorans TaxID=553427 RepID=A0A6I0ESF0_9FIRM|nr:hypothetical protein [Heliorestis acidaminivorans]KAB2951782.1 hypothetical protein F9B85_10845 [Heliorestis acidaminivorans]
MCTAQQYSGELQLILKQLKGRNHRLVHDTQDIAQYLKANRNEKELSELLMEMAEALKKAEDLAKQAITLVEEKEVQEQAQSSPTITVFS